MKNKMAGILIHPTAFYGNYGCGDLGKDSYSLLEWVKSAGFKVLQVLPLNPTGYGDSPYSSVSAFAGNPYLISLDLLAEKGLLSSEDLKKYPKFDKQRVDYELVHKSNFDLLHKAFLRFNNSSDDSYIDFVKGNSFWLKDYALFMALKSINDNTSWHLWPKEHINYKPELLLKDIKIKELYEFYLFIQYEFFIQWDSFKKKANELDIKVFGDIPIFVSYDSADVWANKEGFILGDNYLPKVVAGVPPDYFSETGQLWGNPHYNWENEEKNGFKWWKNRIRHSFRLYDYLRIDHFRGFESYWEIPFGEKTAINGRWVKAKGDELFTELKKIYKSKLSERIIAEDLGVITKEVKALRDKFDLCGMRIFEFATFSSGTFQDDDGHTHNNSDHPFLPENYDEKSIAYTGTHDNDTLLGWFESLSAYEKSVFLSYIGPCDLSDLNFNIIRRILSSQAYMTIFPVQDILSLGTEARFNYPGKMGKENWSWRIKKNELTKKLAQRLNKLIKDTER